ncbi:hypothetical protein KST12_08250 [Fusobacterium polymorphum]|uniref:hypothetical protein n=1 Tax=Fusobacterium nucleatum subsp. polymorphum TaxID=76857 RepID=UPI000A9FD1F3|nr:hypothetical protein [Fusobacterium polymorphum]QYR62513.1 hypothetical protein JY402_07600 [Fusobacterium polymorphum]
MANRSNYYPRTLRLQSWEVQYTLRKNVSKPNGAKPGFVIYVNQKSIVVEKVELEKI